MAPPRYKRIPTLKTADAFRERLRELELELPCDDEILAGEASPLAAELRAGELRIGNRFAIHPMEGWDGTADGGPTERTLRRWRNFGQSGAKLIWGGEAVAVRNDGRANPNQLLASEANRDGLAQLRDELLEAHRELTGTLDGLVVGLQLTHSGRFARPHRKDQLEPRVAFHHPILDRKFPGELHVLDDGELRRLIDEFVRAARMAQELGFDFVDLKHCHGYLGHELLGAHRREGEFGGSFENRTRFLREIIAGVRVEAPELAVGVRLSAFDMPPFRPDPDSTTSKRLGPGIPEPFEEWIPYEFGFGLDPRDPLRPDLRETRRLLELLESLDVRLVNLSAGSPYYNPHIQRPALYPPSDGYQPPEDPLVGVARQIHIVRQLKREFPNLVLVGTGYTYLQEFIVNVAQAVVREGWVDSVGLGRMVLSYPGLPADVLAGRRLEHKRICRTFSDCTTAPRNGIASGCYPLDPYYKESEDMERLRAVKKRRA